MKKKTTTTAPIYPADLVKLHRLRDAMKFGKLADVLHEIIAAYAAAKTTRT